MIEANFMCSTLPPFETSHDANFVVIGSHDANFVVIDGTGGCGLGDFNEILDEYFSSQLQW